MIYYSNTLMKGMQHEICVAIYIHAFSCVHTCTESHKRVYMYVYVDTCTRPRKEEGIEAPGLGTKY